MIQRKCRNQPFTAVMKNRAVKQDNLGHIGKQIGITEHCTLRSAGGTSGILEEGKIVKLPFISAEFRSCTMPKGMIEGYRFNIKMILGTTVIEIFVEQIIKITFRI